MRLQINRFDNKRPLPAGVVLFEFQNTLNGWTDGFVGAVNAADPTAEAALAVVKFFNSTLDASFTSGSLFSANHPTNKFITC